MSDSTSFTSIGRACPRVEGRLKVIGAATFTAEWDVPEVTYGAVVDSAIARGAIREIDTAESLAAPGVIAVVTHENAPRLHPYPDRGEGFQLMGEGGLAEARLPLQDGTIYYGAQSIAVVVANTPEQAQYAASLVHVTYDKQSPELVMESASHQVFPEKFLGIEVLQKSANDAHAAIEEAPVQLSREYHSSICHHNPIELLATIAMWERRDGENYLTLYDTTRALDTLRNVMAHCFDMPMANIRIIAHYIGGAFGSKAWSFFNPVLAALVARVAQRPVKIEWRRQQMYAVAGHRPATKQTLSLGASWGGKISGLIHDSRTHSSPVSGYIEPGARMTRMMYDVANIGYSNRLSYLNLPSPTVMRGPGFQIGSWALECILDELASELEIDPIELRLRNYAETSPVDGLPFSSKRLRECYARGKVLFGWEAHNPRPRLTQVGRHLIGTGMASTMLPSECSEASAQATIFANGSALVRSATHEIGNGAYTIFRQIAADGLDLPIDQVHFELGDTTFPAAPSTHGSVTTATVGTAVFKAARNVVMVLKKRAVGDHESPLFKAALAAINAREGRLYLREHPSIGEEYSSILCRAGLPSVVANGDAKPGDERQQFAFCSFGAVFAEVRVDEMTGVVRVTRLCGVYDVGRIINPRTAHSQLMGGMLFGLGATLMEESLFDPHSGLPVVRNLADYHFPSCADTPEILIEALNVPDLHISELGSRGIGSWAVTGLPPPSLTPSSTQQASVFVVCQLRRIRYLRTHSHALKQRGNDC
ncbi:xanthine dehydrogenase family protein molybdopterin-binding subunit [Ktedonospora formicarum]|uniref:Carbon-monoxide dehydrogenase large subunit n=1 Tax=Ktedonospora formicarum TaxID=2778364 RepID=A0A8J3ICT0_9CHLR|nr:xanthine dehydrogenase family protein molybdopterin-binding subunit [Ktedonospora formicarum]GHO48999.1 carbon-monoxide dehydrogenase large subunit [Ktedonospora formicarum]